MTFKVLAVYDEVTQSFGTPIFVRHVGEGTRSFIDEVNREGSSFGQHANDFSLYYISDFEEDSGQFGAVVRERLVRASDVVRSVAS